MTDWTGGPEPEWDRELDEDAVWIDNEPYWPGELRPEPASEPETASGARPGPPA